MELEDNVNEEPMKTIKLLFSVLCCLFLLNGCRALKEPVVVKNVPIEMFKYAYITPTKVKESSVGSIYGGYSNSINPADVIAGRLIKKGYIILPELKPELTDETLVVNYGESGRHKRGGFGGYTIEVSIQFTSARTNELMCSCTAEGQGSTEADDIRIAIIRALDALFNEENK